MNICLQVENVSKVYDGEAGPVEALAGVSFSVKRSEFVAILGPSGCGKSTLLMMCGGLETVSSGTIAIDGDPVTKPRHTVGVMFQDSTLLPWKTVLQNVMFPIGILRRDRTPYLARAHQMIRMTGLEGFENHKPHELSGGMRQRAAICRALVYDPDILLMDEPFSALDAITRDEMNDALLDIWERYSKTALFVTHSIREAVYLADRVLVMGRRPSTVIADVAIPIARPRVPGVGETPVFNEICAHLRGMVERSHRVARRVALDA